MLSRSHTHAIKNTTEIQCFGHYVDTVGKNAKKIQEYIQKQLEEDKLNDQISLKEYVDPFTGEPADKRKK